MPVGCWTKHLGAAKRLVLEHLAGGKALALKSPPSQHEFWTFCFVCCGVPSARLIISIKINIFFIIKFQGLVAR